MCKRVVSLELDDVYRAQKARDTGDCRRRLRGPERLNDFQTNNILASPLSGRCCNCLERNVIYFQLMQGQKPKAVVLHAPHSPGIGGIEGV